MAAVPQGHAHAVYVWEAPVRLWHWVMMVAMFVLMGTGYLIGVPLFSVIGEAHNQYWFGYVRFLHFAAGYVFAVFLVLRIYWAFVGNKYSREIFLVPFALFTAKFWKGLIDDILFYAYIRREPGSYEGHNPLAAVAMFAMYLLGSVFMIFTGFALYGEGTGATTWQYKMFTSWVEPIFGNPQNIHTWHRFGMWYLIVFSMVHIYMVMRQDVFTNETIVSTMINGWRLKKP
ncbi:MAG: Ni/Fe-hydrogenase, b-type cytochrome subunit [Betaproteobacteria bacterium]|jgi:Ni/Fe-hydrogenase 1 B-type cytochrome subunit